MARHGSFRVQRWSRLFLLGAVASCASARTPQTRPRAPSPASAPAAAAPKQAEAAATERVTPLARNIIAERYQSHLASRLNMTYSGLEKELELKRRGQARLDFDPRGAKYYSKVVKALSLTAEEQRLLRKNGFVSVDHGQKHSMGSLYFRGFVSDLPVLITTDSILYAMHRSFDNALMDMETQVFAPTIDRILVTMHDGLGQRSFDSGELMRAARDADLYLTVARNLAEGAGAPAGKGEREEDLWDGMLSTHSKFDQDEVVLKILKRVQKGDVDVDAPLVLYGSERIVDFTQFEPRGHYARNTRLKRYFRSMMWLGRADTGFALDVARQRRAAALLSMAVRECGMETRLSKLASTLDFVVGKSDDATAAAMLDSLGKADAHFFADVADDAKVESALRILAREGQANQTIRSQALEENHSPTEPTALPKLFQFFGQRFVLDSFVMSKVVFDSIVFQGEKRVRLMPKGLDVMAALGNDEALALLQPEIEKHRYAANLAALRQTVDEIPEGYWRETQYGLWLDTLRSLDEVPDDEPHFPQAMRSQAWQHKQLQTQLGSWAELRHDTILYAKQSYSVVLGCEYPEGYVEPYPQVFAKIESFAGTLAERLGALGGMGGLLGSFFKRFAGIVEKLEAIASKELKAEPLSEEQRSFLRKTINKEEVGSGGQVAYTGWYKSLLFRAEPDDWNPEIADVHSSAQAVAPSEVLEVGVGNAQFLVVAVDNERDRAVYVGPAYSYYEFEVPIAERLTDTEWAERVASKNLPPRPEWTASFAPAPPPGARP